MKNNNYQTIEQQLGVTRKLTPQAIDFEIAVLGAILINQNAMIEVANILSPEMFYKEAHCNIFKSMVELSKKNEPINLLTVSQHLRKSKLLEFVGGPSYLARLTDKVVSSANIEYHARILVEKSMRRNLINLTFELQKEAYDDDGDVLELISKAERNISNLFNLDTNRVLEIRNGLERMLINVANNQTQRAVRDMPTGFNFYDKRSGGMNTTDFVVIAGETSQGKTSLAMSIVKNIAEHGAKLAFFSLEMNTIQLCSRITSIQTGVPVIDILFNKVDTNTFNVINDGIAKLEKLPIYIDDSGTTKFDSIISSIRFMVAKYGIKLAIIDYLQLCSTNEKGKTKEEVLGDMSRRLKNIAKELNICVIALSQLSRDRANPYPTLARLRGSGQIEEAADVVIFTYRPDVYDKRFPEPFLHLETRGYALIDVAKGRNIGTFKFICKFNAETTHFQDIHINDISTAAEEMVDTPF